MLIILFNRMINILIGIEDDHIQIKFHNRSELRRNYTAFFRKSVRNKGMLYYKEPPYFSGIPQANY